MKWNDNLGFLLNLAAKLSKAELNRSLKEYNITTRQFFLIELLNEREQTDKNTGINTPATIAKHLKADRPTITGIIDRLVKQGLVSRNINPDDRRSQSITLTEKSKKLLDKMNFVHKDINKMILKNFKQKEIAAFKDYLFRIISNLNKEEIFCFDDTDRK